MPVNDLAVVAIVGAVILIIAWYLYQVASRKVGAIRYRIRSIVVGLGVYWLVAYVLAEQGLPLFEAVAVGVLVGLGSAWLLIRPPRTDRRISNAVRRQVIARDLTSKGLKWDPTRHHIDHLVPRSRGGDNSPRNLRVVEKQRNLRKGGKMPGFWDILK